MQRGTDNSDDGGGGGSSGMPGGLRAIGGWLVADERRRPAREALEGPVAGEGRVAARARQRRDGHKEAEVLARRAAAPRERRPRRVLDQIVVRRVGVERRRDARRQHDREHGADGREDGVVAGRREPGPRAARLRLRRLPPP